MNISPDEWKEVAFSYDQVREYLQLVALPESEAMRVFGGRSAHLRCFGVGLYFFANGIRREIQPEFGEAFHTLACRVEQVCLHTTVGSWARNADEAERLLTKYFPEVQQ